MTSGYVEQREGVYMVAGARVSLDSIVYAFVSGESAEAIARAFPVLSLEQVYVSRGGLRVVRRVQQNVGEGAANYVATASEPPLKLPYSGVGDVRR